MRNYATCAALIAFTLRSLQVPGAFRASLSGRRLLVRSGVQGREPLGIKDDARWRALTIPPAHGLWLVEKWCVYTFEPSMAQSPRPVSLYGGEMRWPRARSLRRGFSAATLTRHSLESGDPSQRVTQSRRPSLTSLDRFLAFIAGTGLGISRSR